MIASHNIRVCIDPYDSLLSYQADQLVVAKKRFDNGLMGKGDFEMLCKACGLHVVVEVKLPVAVLGWKRD